MPSTYEPIATQTLSSTATSVTFSSIPQTYTDLRIVLAAGYSFTDTLFTLELNGNTSAIYSGTDLNGTGSVANSGRSSNQVNFQSAGWYPYPNDASTIGNGIYDIFQYTNTSVNKTVLWRLNNTVSGSTGARVGLFRSTAAVTSLKFAMLTYLSPSFTVGSTFTLYGIKAA